MWSHRDGSRTIPCSSRSRFERVSERDDDLDQPFDLYLDPATLVGRWADSTWVHRGRDEFTIDFVRHVPAPHLRALVVRAVLSPIQAVELRDRLDDAWRAYSEWSMPEEQR